MRGSGWIWNNNAASRCVLINSKVYHCILINKCLRTRNLKLKSFIFNLQYSNYCNFLVIGHNENSWNKKWDSLFDLLLPNYIKVNGTYSSISYAAKILKQSWVPFLKLSLTLRESVSLFWTCNLNPDDARHTSRFALVVGRVTLHITLLKVSGPAKTYGLTTKVRFTHWKIMLLVVFC